MINIPLIISLLPNLHKLSSDSPHFLGFRLVVGSEDQVVSRASVGVVEDGVDSFSSDKKGVFDYLGDS